MHVIIDLFGDDEDVIDMREKKEDPEAIKRQEELRQRFLEEMFRRAPQPQVVPVERGK